jgi:hypothetical protein
MVGFVDLTIKGFLENEASEIVFELNNERTRNHFRNIIELKLKFHGIKNFVVVCDETNNMASVIYSNQFVCDVYHEDKLYHLLICNNGAEVEEYKKAWELV